jgi:hypothetical protein
LKFLLLPEVVQAQVVPAVQEVVEVEVEVVLLMCHLILLLQAVLFLLM